MNRMKRVERTLIALAILVATNTSFVSPELTVTRVPVLEGQAAEMPCDVRPPMKNDSLLLVVWYKEEKPVYSYDTRVSNSDAHWADDQFRGRASWHNTPTAGIYLKRVLSQDRAAYTCRVDFHVSPTRNYKVTLDVIELPGKPIIFDEHSKEILNAAGPYHEDGSFKLTCKVKGGYPIPRIQWFKDDDVISLATLRSTDNQDNPELRTLELEVSNVTRNYFLSRYTCSADNTVLAPPQKTTVSIDLYLKPLKVEMIYNKHQILVGKKEYFRCITTGSSPPANISWWLGDMKINTTAYDTIISDDFNKTESVLKLIPLKEHNYKVLTCRAEHPKYNFSHIQSNVTLFVAYPPEAIIVFGDQVDPEAIEEGTNVTFDCKVDANPPAHQVVWRHNGLPLLHDLSEGVIVGNAQLTLRNVSRRRAGHYSCIAANAEGDGESAHLNMHITYKPICQRSDVTKIGAALLVTATLICEVDAFPLPETFEWTLNNSARFTTVDPERFSVEGKEGRSILSYAPLSDVDYGIMECRATNAVGQQLSPCVFTLIPASRPEAPSNCTVYNLTYDSMDILCQPGYDGGLLCVYVVEIWASEGLVVNASSDAPSWNLRRLGANRQLRAIVYTANVRGRSAHVSFNVTTAIKMDIMTDVNNIRDWELSWVVGVFLGVILTVAIILCCALIATKIQRRSRDYEVNISALKNQTIIPPKLSASQIAEEKNPDLIPLNKGANNVPDPPQYWDITTQAQLKNSRLTHSLARIQPTTMSGTTHKHYNSLQNDDIEFKMKGNAPTSQREIVTTKTPLLSVYQESFV